MPLSVQPLANQGTISGVAQAPTQSLGMTPPVLSRAPLSVAAAAPAQPISIQQPDQQVLSYEGTADNPTQQVAPLPDAIKQKMIDKLTAAQKQYPGQEAAILHQFVQQNIDKYPAQMGKVQGALQNVSSPLNTGNQRIDGNNNLVAAGISTNSKGNDITKALDGANIPWEKGTPWGDGSMSTIKINADPVEGARAILANSSAIQNWYINHTGKDILPLYGVKNNEDFKKLDTATQNKIIDGIASHEVGRPTTTAESTVGKFKPADILSELVKQNQPQQNKDQSQTQTDQPSSELFRSGISTLARTIQSTPDVAKAVYQAAVDPQTWNLLFQNPLQFLKQGLGGTPEQGSATQQANQTMQAPLLGANTLQGESNEQAGGQALEALSYLPTPFSSLLRGASFGAGNAMENNASPLSVGVQAAGSALLFKGTDLAAPLLGKLGSAVIPQGLQDVASAGIEKIQSLLGQVGDKINPALDKVVPDFVTSNKNVIQQGAEKIFGKQFLQSNVDSWNEIFSGTKSAKKNLLTSLDRDKDPAGFLGSRGIMPSIDTSSGTPKWNAQPAIQKVEALTEPYNEVMGAITKAKDALMSPADMVNLDDIAAKTKAVLNNSTNRGAGSIPSMEADVDAEITNLKKIYGDTVNASQLDEIRKGQWGASTSFRRIPNPSTPFKGDVHFQLGSIARSIEGKILPEVEPILGTLSDHYDAINNLSKIDGNAVKNGKSFLSKLSNQMVGALIGNSFGPLGAIGGDILAGAASDVVNNFAINNPLKVAVLRSIPPDSAIYDAAQEALQKLQAGEYAAKAARAPLSLPAASEGASQFGGGEPINLHSKIKPLESNSSMGRRETNMHYQLPEPSGRAQGDYSQTLSQPTKIRTNSADEAGGNLKRIGGKGSTRTVNASNVNNGQISAPAVKRGSYNQQKSYKARYLQRIIDEAKALTSK